MHRLTSCSQLALDLWQADNREEEKKTESNCPDHIISHIPVLAMKGREVSHA